MIPVVHFNKNTVYTVTTHSQIVRGEFTSASMGTLLFERASVYDLKLAAKRYADEIEIDYADITSAGFCSENDRKMRNNLCWQLNDADVGAD